MRRLFDAAARARRESGSLAEFLLDSATAAAFVKDDAGRLVYANPCFERALGASLEKLRGKTDHDWLPAAAAEQSRAREEIVLATGRAMEAEEILPTPEGPRHFLVLRFPLGDESGGRFVGGVAVEVTERKRAAEALMRVASIVDSSEDAIIGTTLEGTVLTWNAGAERIYGYSAEEMKGLTVSLLEPPDRRGEIRATIEHVCREKTVARYETVRVRKDETRVEVAVTLSPIRDRDGHVTGVASIARDITARRQAEKALGRAEAKYRDIFENAIEGIFQTTPEGRYRSANPALARMLGYESPEELIAKRTDIEHQHYVDPSERAEFRRRVEQEVAVWDFEYQAYRKDGTKIWVSENARAVRDTDGTLLYYEGNVEDITEHRQAKELIVHHAYHDPLTGLPNRTLLTERLALSIAQARRTRRAMAVLYLDLDRFKLINDTWGHSIGDLLFQAVAQRLTGCLREADTVARIGGDEFVVLLSEVARPEDATIIAQKLLQAIAQPFLVEGQALRITTSMGISLYPKDGEDAASLLRNADNAMYRAKEFGRNNFQLCTEEVTAEAIKRLSLHAELRRALELEELTLHYQPVLSLTTGRIVALEALVRWQHPEKGLVLPAGFISAAEETGLILPLGKWVLENASRQLKAWQNKGFPGLRMAVNLSSRQFHDVSLAQTVDAILAAAGVEARHLEIEITERIAMEDAEVTVANLLALRGMNVGISVDDFGTGYSSLSYLKKFPVTTLKIDQSFISDVATNSADAGIVRAVVEMAHGMKLNVIAEGVETKEQFAHLRQSGCDEIQGFWFSRPLSVEAVERLLDEELERWIPKA